MNWRKFSIELNEQLIITTLPAGQLVPYHVS